MSTVLEVNDLQVEFHSDWGIKEALAGVSFTVRQGEICCLVGESGSGKTALALAILGLLPRNGRVSGGEILYKGQDLVALSEQQLDQVRGQEIAMIFQDAQNSLNPVFTIGNQVDEAVLNCQQLSKKEVRQETLRLLSRVGLAQPAQLVKQYPHTLSGGMKQRVMIAMALAGNPKLLIADEPTTALDVTIQAQIMELLAELVVTENLSVLLITHDMGLVAQMAQRVLVLYAGELVEQSSVEELFAKPVHPYTKKLMAAVPHISQDRSRRLSTIPGEVPESYEDLSGCRFLPRCTYAKPPCKSPQELLVLPPVQEKHLVRCQRALEPSWPVWETADD